MPDSTRHFFSGLLSGIAGTTISQPFFTLKTYMQNNEKFVFSQSVSKNIKFLYSGIVRSCVGYGIEKSLVFGTYNFMINKFNLSKENLKHTLFAGFVSGFVASFSIAPFEQLTIDKQRNIKNYSLINLYKGIIPTIARESIGFSVYFTTYDQLSKKYNPEKSTLKTMLIGSSAVLSAWSIITPIDKIKTNIQSNVKININSIFSAYKGFNFALMRAIPFHVTCFVVFEFLDKNTKILYHQ